MAAMRVLLIVAVVVLAVTEHVEGKRGCSAFGHSCYGGHGKRSGNPNAFGEAAADPMSLRDLLLDRRGHAGGGVEGEVGGGGGEREVAGPRTVYPHADGLGLEEAGNIIPIRNGGIYEHAGDTEVPAALFKLRLRNIVRHWINSHRQRNLEDGLQNIGV